MRMSYSNTLGVAASCFLVVFANLCLTEVTNGGGLSGNVCNKTVSVKEAVRVRTKYTTYKTEPYKSCTFWVWGCEIKQRKVAVISYRMKQLPVGKEKQKVVYECCQSYIEKDNVCVPDCSKLDCAKNCSNCPSEHAYCNHVTGECHCFPGYWNNSVECMPCPPGVYGENCSRQCACPESRECNSVSGVCSSECEDTLHGCRASNDSRPTQQSHLGQSDPVTIPVVCAVSIIIVATIVGVVVVVILRKRRRRKEEEAKSINCNGQPGRAIQSYDNQIYSADDVVEPSGRHVTSKPGVRVEIPHGGEVVPHHHQTNPGSPHMMENELYLLD